MQETIINSSSTNDDIDCTLNCYVTDCANAIFIIIYDVKQAANIISLNIANLLQRDVNRCTPDFIVLTSLDFSAQTFVISVSILSK